VPELGQLFTIGFQLAYFVPIGIGIVLCVALAMALDLVVVMLTRMLTPWTRAVTAP
jgi:osmoprotectant transport system permease protein